MKFLKEEEDAVSPVIGVILMVAITVILAAVIAAFVFGMAGTVKSTKNVAATASQEGTTVFVTYQGGADHAAVDSYRINVLPAGNTTIPTQGKGPVVAPTVGNMTAVGSTGTPGQDRVTVTATFTDGSQQVILDTYV